MDKIEIIKDRVDLKNLLELYWGKADRNGRYKCVFHNGKDNNMGVTDKLCHCFVCNEGGNAITVVKAIFNISTSEAIKKIDEDFRLGLGKPLTAQEKRKYAEQQRKKERERKRWLEWLWNVITEDTKYMLDEDFVLCYGTDRVDILRKIYAKEILI